MSNSKRIPPMAHESTKAEYAAPKVETKAETLPAVVKRNVPAVDEGGEAAMVANGAKFAATPKAPDEFTVPGADELTREDMTFPRLILTQAQHTFPGAEKHVGEWYNDLMGTYHPTLETVVMGLHKTRVAFPRKFSRDSEPLCGSDDAKYPRADYVGVTITDDVQGITATIDGTACQSCPFSKFGENSEPPLCAKTYAYALYDFAESGMPILVQAQRAGSQAAKKLNTLASMLGRRKTILLGSTKVTSDTGSYFVPVFAAGGNTPRDIVGLVNDMTQSMGNPALRAKPEAEESPARMAETGFGNTTDDDSGGF